MKNNKVGIGKKKYTPTTSRMTTTTTTSDFKIFKKTHNDFNRIKKRNTNVK